MLWRLPIAKLAVSAITVGAAFVVGQQPGSVVTTCIETYDWVCIKSTCLNEMNEILTNDLHDSPSMSETRRRALSLPS